MPIDGEIDYRSCTREQLDEALSSIDRERYPRNYEALIAEIERRKAEDAAVAGGGGETAAPDAYRLYRPEFNADPQEYFRIWIVNLALSIVTLGIYSAWAKVRRLRYFYGATVLAGSAFGYHGDPRKILKGRIIAAVLAGAYIAATRTSELATLIVVALLGVATPWLVVRSRMFALRVTSWRGLRFDFSPDYRGAYAVLLGWLILGFVTLGILMPRFVRERYRFIVSRSRFGTTAFECNPGIARFYKTAFAAIGLGIVVVFVVGILASIFSLMVSTLPVPRAVRSALLVVVVGLIYVLMLSAMQGYTQARNLNEVIGHTSIGPHRLNSTLSAGSLMCFYATNFLFIVLTLGLYTPWAQIRLARYRLESIELEAHGSLDDFVAASVIAPAATGEEISSLLDVDFGL